VGELTGSMVDANREAAARLAQSTSVPKSIRAIEQVLEDMGVKSYEPRITHQLLEFAYSALSLLLLAVATRTADVGAEYAVDVVKEAQILVGQGASTVIVGRDMKTAMDLVEAVSMRGPPSTQVSVVIHVVVFVFVVIIINVDVVVVVFVVVVVLSAAAVDDV
jgi:hypothetical protein